MIRTRKHIFGDGKTISGDRYDQVMTEEEKWNCENYETYVPIHLNYLTANFVVKVRRSKGQLELRMEQGI